MQTVLSSQIILQSWEDIMSKKDTQQKNVSKKVRVRQGSKGDNSFFAEFEVNGGKYVIAWEAVEDRELSVKFNIGIQQIIEEVEQVDDGHSQ
jgi:hypothetical protein